MLSIKIRKSGRIAQEAAKFLKGRLEEKLEKKRKILLLLSGGGAVEVYKNLTGWIEKQNDGFAQDLIVGLVDERFGKMGHANSNERQIRQTGFYEAVEKKGGRVLKVLTGKNPQQEAERYNLLIQQTIEKTDEIWAVLGVGADGHTAGIFPKETPEEFEKTFLPERWVVYYKLPQDYPNPFKKRITLTPEALRNIDLGVVVLKSQGKERTLRRMFSPNESIYRTPAVLLRVIPAGFLVCDGVN